MKLSKVILYLPLLLAPVANSEPHSSDLQRNCKPCMTYFVWGCDDSEENLRVQKHFLSRVMDTMTIGSNIEVRACDNTVANFIKNNSKSVLENFAAVNFVLSKDHIMSYISLKKDMSGYIQQKAKNKSLELFFFVNENTKIDKSETAMEELKKNKVFVAYHGPAPVPSFWKSMATDEHHLLHLKHNIEDDFLAVLNVMCHDSRLYCDNDLYWNGSECFTCSYICTQIPSKYCKKECPYFNPFYSEGKHLEENNCSHELQHIITIVILFGVVNSLLSCSLISIIVYYMFDCFRGKIIYRKVADTGLDGVQENESPTNSEKTARMNGSQGVTNESNAGQNGRNDITNTSISTKAQERNGTSVQNSRAFQDFESVISSQDTALLNESNRKMTEKKPDRTSSNRRRSRQ